MELPTSGGNVDALNKNEMENAEGNTLQFVLECLMITQ